MSLHRIYLDKKVERDLRKNLTKQDHIELYNYDVLKFIQEDIINMENNVLIYYHSGKVCVFDKRKEWMTMVNPKLHKMYSELREELMSVPFYQEMLKGEK